MGVATRVDDVSNNLLRSLEQHPGWRTYLELADELCNSEVEKLARRAMATTEGGIDAGDLQYRRGFIAGMKTISRKPAIERRLFEKAFANQEEHASA